jgi:predicted exporter
MIVTRHSGLSFRLQAGFWLALSLLSIAIIAARFEMTVDLGYFLPPPTTDQERVLVERLGQGPGSRLLFISIPIMAGQDIGALRAQLRTSLRASKLFMNVIDGDLDLGIASMPEDLRRDRFLLSDMDLSPAGLRVALRERQADMAMIADDSLLSLMAEDPYLASVRAAEALAWSDNRRTINWQSQDGRELYMIAETVAPAFDMAAQAQAVTLINAVAEEVVSQPPALHGVGAYGVELQQVIEAEAQQRTILAIFIIALVLLLAYRRWQVIWLAALPLSIGAVVGLAAVVVIFGPVHGITLAFGFTLFGVAVDYPLHLLSHMRHDDRDQAVELTWPTIRLGAFSTGIAYLALLASGSIGLAQLGVFSATGIIVALYATRSLLPGLAPSAPTAPVLPVAGRPRVPGFQHGYWVFALLGGVVIVLLTPRTIWNNDLAAMTPIAPAKLLRDRELRRDLGAPDIRYLLTISAPDQEVVLQQTERLEGLLQEAQRASWLERYQLVTTLVPSLMTQQRRLAQIQNATTNIGELTEVMRELSLRPEAFQAFFDGLRDGAERGIGISTESLRDASLREWANSQLYFDGVRWTSVTTLIGLSAPAALSMALTEGLPGATLVDLKVASESLVAGYRQRVLLLLGMAFLVIVVFLRWRIGAGPRLFWICGTLVAAVSLTAALTFVILGALSLFSLFALVLVSGLGLDYALFASRTEADQSNRRNTLHALTVCAASTLFAFLVLGLSSVPILQALGVTVSIGVGCNYLLTFCGIQHVFADD